MIWFKVIGQNQLNSNHPMKNSVEAYRVLPLSKKAFSRSRSAHLLLQMHTLLCVFNFQFNYQRFWIQGKIDSKEVHDQLWNPIDNQKFDLENFEWS